MHTNSAHESTRSAREKRNASRPICHHSSFFVFVNDALSELASGQALGAWSRVRKIVQPRASQEGIKDGIHCDRDNKVWTSCGTIRKLFNIVTAVCQRALSMVATRERSWIASDTKKYASSKATADVKKNVQRSRYGVSIFQENIGS